MKAGPVSSFWTAVHIFVGQIIPQWIGYHFVDATFYQRDSLYWWWALPQKKIWNSEFDLITGQTRWRHASALSEGDYGSFPLWTDRDPSKPTSRLGWWNEVLQGSLGNCYLITSMSSVAALRPDKIKDLFVQKEKNSAGIYNIKLYIRGRPTLITVDDNLLFEYSTPSWTSITGDLKNLFYARISQDNPALWAPLLEKAFAKVGTNYGNTEGGLPYLTTRALLGCPVVGTYYFVRLANQADSLWDSLEKESRERGYLHTVTTVGVYGVGDDTRVNSCGITGAHAFPVLAYVGLYDAATGSSLEHRLVMLRDPRGAFAFTASNQTWNVRDSASWNNSTYRS